MDIIRQAPRHLQGQHYNMLDETHLQLMRTSSNDMPRGNMGTHHPCKEQSSSRINKDGKEYVKHNIPGTEKSIWVREKTNVRDEFERVKRRKWPWARQISRIRDNSWTQRITSWKPYERKTSRRRPAIHRRDDLDDYWKGTM